jgi:hypothetical protein
MDVDKLFAERVSDLNDWRGEVLAQLRKIVEIAAPNAELNWKWNSPVWMQNGLILSLGSFSDHLKIHFFKGAALQDKSKLFNSGLEAKTTRGIDIFKEDNLNEDKLIDLIREAVAFNSGH